MESGAAWNVSMGNGTQKPATIRDVARTAGVSVGTVSRSLNAPDTVRPATLELVLETIKKLGFKPDARAQGMRRRNTLMVGFIVSDISNPLHAMLFKAAETHLREHGYSLHLVNTAGNAGREVDAIDMMQHGRVDGIIMTVSNERDRRCLDRIATRRVPVVLIDREIKVDVDTVLADHVSGMEQAVDYLLELGHRRIALITFGDEILPGRERVRGFIKAFKSRGIEPPLDLIRAHKPTADFGFGEASALLQRSDPPTAIIAGGNQFLAGVLKAIQQQRIAVPEQVSLVTCDRTDLAALYPVPLTVIDRNIDEMGRTAAQLLLDRIGGDTDQAAHRVRIPTTLVLGRSTGRPPREAAVALRAPAEAR